MINEQINLSSPVMVTDVNGNVLQAAHLSASLDSGNQNLSFSMNVINKELIKNNPEVVWKQYDDFQTAFRNRAKDLGFLIFN